MAQHHLTPLHPIADNNSWLNAVPKNKFSSAGKLILALLLSVYLSAAAEFQLFLDLAETTRHSMSTAQGESYGALSLKDLTHDCHGCLASHPNLTVSPTLRDFWNHRAQRSGRSEISRIPATLSECLNGINNRSPPA